MKRGLYEFRYHLDGKHDVAFISAPFEIKLRHIEVPLESAEADELANQLRKYIFDHVVSGSR